MMDLVINVGLIAWATFGVMSAGIGLVVIVFLGKSLKGEPLRFK